MNKALIKRIKEGYKKGTSVYANTLRLLAPMLDDSIMEFDTKKGINNDYKLAFKVEDPDIFHATEWRLSITTVPVEKSKPIWGKAQNFDFPNHEILTGAAEATNAEAIYNGNIKIGTGSVGRIKNVPSRSFRGYPLAIFPATSERKYPIPSGIVEKWVKMTPNQLFSGAVSNEISLSIQSVGASLTPDPEKHLNFATIEFRGFTIEKGKENRLERRR